MQEVTLTVEGGSGPVPARMGLVQDGAGVTYQGVIPGVFLMPGSYSVTLADGRTGVIRVLQSDNAGARFKVNGALLEAA